MPPRAGSIHNPCFSHAFARLLGLLVRWVIISTSPAIGVLYSFLPVFPEHICAVERTDME